MASSSLQSLNSEDECQLAKVQELERAAEEEIKIKAAAIKEKFPVGSYCRAMYSEDGCFYEGKVILWKEYTCMVQFLGYRTREEVEFKNLMPSKGKKKRENQKRKANKTYMMDHLLVVDGGEGIKGREFDYNFLTGAGDTENTVNLAAAVYCPPPEIRFPVGSYCRAMYSGNGCFFEGKVILWNEYTCMVEFLGLKTSDEVESKNLKPSKGKKARNSQRRIANKFIVMNRLRAFAGREADDRQVHEDDFPIGAEAAENTENMAAAANFAPPDVPTEK